MTQTKRLIAFAVAFVLALALVSGCTDNNAPADPPPALYAKYLVQQAIERYDDDGRQATFDYYNSPESVDGSWYVFILEGDLAVANANRPDIVGTSTAERVDINGKPYGQELVAATEDGVWVDYYFTHPVSGVETEKHTWALRHDGLVFASGWYQ